MTTLELIKAIRVDFTNAVQGRLRVFSAAEIDAYFAKLEEAIAQQADDDAGVRAVQLKAANDLQLAAYIHSSEAEL